MGRGSAGGGRGFGDSGKNAKIRRDSLLLMRDHGGLRGRAPGRRRRPRAWACRNGSNSSWTRTRYRIPRGTASRRDGRRRRGFGNRHRPRPSCRRTSFLRLRRPSRRRSRHRPGCSRRRRRSRPAGSRRPVGRPNRPCYRSVCERRRVPRRCVGALGKVKTWALFWEIFPRAVEPVWRRRRRAPAGRQMDGQVVSGPVGDRLTATRARRSPGSDAATHVL